MAWLPFQKEHDRSRPFPRTAHGRLVLTEIYSNPSIFYGSYRVNTYCLSKGRRQQQYQTFAVWMLVVVGLVSEKIEPVWVQVL